MNLIHSMFMNFISEPLPQMVNPKAVQWYKQLKPDQKIGVKLSFTLLCDIKFEDVIKHKLFNLLECITIVYNKLVHYNVIDDT